MDRRPAVGGLRPPGGCTSVTTPAWGGGAGVSRGVDRRMFRRTFLMVLALVFAVGLTACGGGGDDDEAADETAEEDDTATSTTSADDPADDAATSTTAAPGAPGDAPAGDTPPAEATPGDVGTQLGVDRTFTGEGSDTFCAQVADIQEQQMAGSGPTDDATTAAQLAAVAAPEEIAAGWSNLHEVMAQAAEDPT